MLDFKIEKNVHAISEENRNKILQNPGFGNYFSDHMAMIDYSKEKGWHNARIVPYSSFNLEPASSVFHYAQEIFEGLKAYHYKDGISLFRPMANAERFRKSAQRLAMAELPEELFVKSIEMLVSLDKDWIPRTEGASLYIRPFMISSDVFLGVKPSEKYSFCVLASPAGNYFHGKGETVDVWVSETYTRAAPGGTGEAKCGGNYASSLVAQNEAAEQGCAQVLFLDAVERKYIEEMGGMNIMFVHKDGYVMTPSLTGTILRGITRDSLLKLGRETGLDMREERISIDDIFSKTEKGEITEAFACGTAAVISPIGTLKRQSGSISFGDGKSAGAVTQTLKKTLLDVQSGNKKDNFHWCHIVSQ